MSYYGLTLARRVQLERELLKAAEPPLLFQKFAAGKYVKTTWRERLSSLLHFKIPRFVEFIPFEQLPPPGSTTVRFRRCER